eukprot:10376748-Alexandrium_andersonii.AAC.1
MTRRRLWGCRFASFVRAEGDSSSPGNPPHPRFNCGCAVRVSRAFPDSGRALYPFLSTCTRASRAVPSCSCGPHRRQLQSADAEPARGLA